MAGRSVHLQGVARRPARARLRAVDRVSVALGAVWVAAAVFYLWTAGTSYPLTLGGAQQHNPYDLLASALLHLHLSVGRPPAGLLKLPDPYNPVANSFLQLHPQNIHDYALYHGKLYLTWGPVPAIVLVAPLHLLGLTPSTSLIAAVFAIAGLAFALATLRVVVRQLGGVALWACVLAALALALSSVVPFLLRRPEVYEDAIAGGFCFAMAGVWLAATAIVDRRASLWRLAAMSLCFGLAAGSRPPLGVAAAVLVPVYLAVRATPPLRSRRALLLALGAPLGVCVALLAAYNLARFGNPLEVGVKYVLAGNDPRLLHYGALKYVLPGAWYYALSPPRPSVLFPFLALAPPPVSYPGSLPTGYEAFELTGGVLPMAPIVLFLGALPWIWRRRPTWLGSLGSPLLLLAGAGVAIAAFLSYEFFATTERYEVDFATLLLLGALAAWLALAGNLRGGRRRVVQVCGGLAAVWGCLTGLAIGFTGYADLLAVEHPATWAKLESATTPVSEALAAVAGGPVVAEVNARRVLALAPSSYTSFESTVKTFALGVGEPAGVTVVSPDTRAAALVVRAIPGMSIGTGAAPSNLPAGLLVSGPGSASSSYSIPAGGTEVRVPVQLTGGVNRLALAALAAPAGAGSSAVPAARQLVVVTHLTVAGA